MWRPVSKYMDSRHYLEIYYTVANCCRLSSVCCQSLASISIYISRYLYFSISRRVIAIPLRSNKRKELSWYNRAQQLGAEPDRTEKPSDKHFAVVSNQFGSRVVCCVISNQSDSILRVVATCLGKCMSVFYFFQAGNELYRD